MSATHGPILTLPGKHRQATGKLPSATVARLKPPLANKNGRPPYVATAGDKQKVTVFRSCGLPIPDIAVQLGISINTLRKYYSEELANGMATIVSRIGAQVVKKALAGDNGMIVFYLKNHGGEAWKDKQRLEHTGADGAPLQPPNLIVSFLEAAPPDEGS